MRSNFIIYAGELRRGFLPPTHNSVQISPFGFIFANREEFFSSDL